MLLLWLPIDTRHMSSCSLFWPNSVTEGKKGNLSPFTPSGPLRFSWLNAWKFCWILYNRMIFIAQCGDHSANICYMNWCFSWCSPAWRNNASRPLIQIPDRRAWGSRSGIRTGSRQRSLIRLEDTGWSVWTKQHTLLIPEAGRVASREEGTPRACLWLSLSPPSPFIIGPLVNMAEQRGPRARRKEWLWWCGEQLQCHFLYKLSRSAEDR